MLQEANEYGDDKISFDEVHFAIYACIGECQAYKVDGMVGEEGIGESGKVESLKLLAAVWSVQVSHTSTGLERSSQGASH